MLNSTTAEIAHALTGYEPCSIEEAEVQYPAEPNYDPANFKAADPATHPRSGSIRLGRNGILCCYWRPVGQEDQDELEGWYDVPTTGEVEEMCLDQAYTPAGDYVEADHPDSWPVLLNLI